MHADWIKFLQTLELSNHLVNNHKAFIAPLSHLAIISLSGNDAAQFLQGQVTCDIKALTDFTPALGAFCNAQGRTVSTFIVIKQGSSYQLIVTKDLLDIVSKKLQMYILRSDVQLTDQSEQLCLLGVYNADLAKQQNLFPYPQLDKGLLYIGNPEQAQIFTASCLEKGFLAVEKNIWTGLEIQASLPWLYQQTTESFVPQMLNLDKLNAISFNKGCYTGQEIVARTHYLGKNKRAMYLASCTSGSLIEPGCSISDAANPESKMGTVIVSSHQANDQQLLVVLKDQAITAKNLQLNNQNHDKIMINNSQE